MASSLQQLTYREFILFELSEHQYADGYKNVKDAKIMVRIWVDQEHRKIKFRLMLDHEDRGRMENNFTWTDKKKNYQNMPKKVGESKHPPPPRNK